MSKRTRILATIFGGWFGLHKYLDKHIGMGILYTFTCGLFGIGWVIDILKSISFKETTLNIEEPTLSIEPTSSIQSESYKNRFEEYEEMNTISHKYFSGLDEIESMWSVMYNLGITSGEQADTFIEKCYTNLSDLHDMLVVNEKYGYDNSIPPHVPAYVRLAMLYEKQQEYQKAIDICVQAIRAGAINDGNKGKMYGRLARLIKKSGLPVEEEILSLTQKTN